MAEPDIAEQSGNEDRAVVRSVSRALWRADLSKDVSVEDRKSSWSEGKAEYRKQARRLVRSLESEGVTLTKAAGDESDADDDD